MCPYLLEVGLTFCSLQFWNFIHSGKHFSRTEEFFSNQNFYSKYQSLIHLIDDFGVSIIPSLSIFQRWIGKLEVTVRGSWQGMLLFGDN